jgi:hypothetical protein
MNRQLIVGRFGPEDQISIPSATDEQVTQLDIVAGERSLNHGIGGALTSLKQLGVFPSEIGLDLLIVAAHVHAADTRISRTEQSQDSWTREIRLVIPVSDPNRWSTAADTLTRMLGFLTGDRWTIGFRSRPERFLSITTPRDTLLPTTFDALSLFSGGLDSLIGAIDLLENGRIPLLISHAGESASSDAQNKLFSKLKNHYTALAFDRLRLPMVFANGLVEGVHSENSTRGRSFLFFALGVFAGTGTGSDFVLRVPENGLIALNVPLDPLRLGSNSTRTTHPFYMARWNDLLVELGIGGRVENPYWNKTKGEMALREWTATSLGRRRIPFLLITREEPMARSRDRALWVLPSVLDSSRCARCSLGAGSGFNCLHRARFTSASVGHKGGKWYPGTLVSICDRAIAQATKLGKITHS